MGKATNGNYEVSSGGDQRALCQKFTTGTLNDASATFALAGVEINLERAPGDSDEGTFKVTLQTVTDLGNPSDEIFQFTNPDTVVKGRQQFTAPANTQLTQSANYAILVEYASNTDKPKIRRTSDDGEDAGKATDWSIDDELKIKNSNGGWVDNTTSLKIRVLMSLNTPPTAADGTVVINEGATYTFEAGDFGFQDGDNSDSDTNNDDTLDHVKITSVPGTGEGTLWLDANNDGDTDAGEAVAIDNQVAAGDIDDGKLRYTAPASGSGKLFTTFKFKVNDGLVDSAEYNMSIDVNVVLVSNLGQSESNFTISVGGTNQLQQAQGFTTGDNPKGYDLGNIELKLGGQLDAGTFTVKLSSPSTPSGGPGGATDICTLTTPNPLGAGVQEFGAGQCAALTRSTRYLVLMDFNPSQTGDRVSLKFTVSDAEDSGSDSGGLIDDGTYFKHSTNNWTSQDAYTHFIKVNGALLPNALPTAAVNTTVTTNEDATYTFTEANFSLSDDDTGDTLYAVITSLPDAGTLWLDADTTDGAMVDGEEVSVDDSVVKTELTKLKYTPPADANGDPFTTFGFKVNDGYEDSASEYTITLDVTAVNDAPVVTGLQAISVAENTDVDENPVATYTATDVDLDDTIDEWELSGNDSNYFSIVDGILSFKSSPDYEDAVRQGDNTYEIEVGAKDSNNATGWLRGITVTVTNVNEAPEAVDDTYSTDQGTALVIPVSNDPLEGVLDNDADEDGDTLSVTEVTDPPNGTATLANDKTTITYTPNTGFAGIDTFTYTVSDGSDTPALTDTGMVTVKVRPDVSGGYAHNYAENGTGSVATYTAGGGPTWSLAGTDSDKLSIDSGGVLTFNSPPDYESPSGGEANNSNDYQVTVEATVGTGDDAVTGTLDVTVTVNDADDYPVITVDPSLTLDESGTLMVTIAENTALGTAIATFDFVDQDGDPLSDWNLPVGDDKDAFTLDPSDTVSPVNLIFNNPPNFEAPTDRDTNNTYEVTVQVYTYPDAQSLTGAALPVIVTVTDVNEAPVATADTPTTDEDTAVVISVLANDTDEDAGTILSVSAVGTVDGVNTATEINPANGTAVITAGSTTTITYTPNADYYGSDSFTYTVSDGADPALTAVGTVTGYGERGERRPGGGERLRLHQRGNCRLHQRFDQRLRCGNG